MSQTKTVVEKLNISKYPTKLILNKPEDIHDFDELKYDPEVKQEQYDVIFQFVFSIEDFHKQLQNVIGKQLVKESGYLYIAYPKKNNPQYKEYIDRDRFLQEIALDEEGYIPDSNLKFSRMVSLNEVFTVVGLKSGRKKTTKASSAKSQCVDDYIVNIEDIQQYLYQNKELLQFFNQLTPGYQKDWARYVYSAKRKETQEKRLAEMKKVLSEGFKTMDLYKRNKK
ncbi:YdeI/OmpD-associated family protein [Bacillus sp. FJAT-49736]|uniref:YdeI/OmpD-associated family protein n=1 Tax=Bacillus sp. FJAT-49736 TaxID=2833582 RepID=UPI001BC90846|nr:YdeI/OmpD-associated family protein [Bacillus sp. FJAT-49736]MBS4174851.1 YdeI/OmpD-associated family protein [Bacillus sp. FJAT-49736]